MLNRALLNHILHNDNLTRGLNDPEARVLVEWTVERAELLASVAASEDAAQMAIVKLCERCRAISRFVVLWCYENIRGGAVQLAATQQFTWPLPTSHAEPWQLMQEILGWEGRLIDQAVTSGSCR